MNAKEVLAKVDSLIVEVNAQAAVYPYKRGYVRIIDCYRDLGIFDWFKETLSASDLEKMRDFLLAAIVRGYTGYVCFKVGAKMCANGMWAYVSESETGYSPDNSAFLYRSFTPDYTTWDAYTKEGYSAKEWWRERGVNRVDGLTKLTQKQVDIFCAMVPQGKE